MLDADQAKALGWAGVDSQWHENFVGIDSVEFTVLLPGYLMGQSNWAGELISPVPAKSENGFPAQKVYDPELTLLAVPQGLMIHYRKPMTESDTISLGITYQPNQGLDETAKVTATFKLSDGWFD